MCVLSHYQYMESFELTIDGEIAQFGLDVLDFALQLAESLVDGGQG